MKKAGIVISLTLMLGLFSPTVASADNYSCDATGVILGTNGADVIQGTSGADVICALGGDDEINGLGGDDVIIGGEGDDEIIGDDGVDILYGGPGADQLYGSADPDKLYGGDGKDRLDGGPSKDYLDGEGGLNTCIKTSGSDTYRNCFYDGAGPSLVAAAISPNSAVVDTESSVALVELKLTISDPGVGFSHGSLSFKNYGSNDSRKNTRNVSLELGSCGEADVRVTMKSGDFFCRESGDALLGIYRAGLHLSTGSLLGKWNLNSINLFDKLNNQRTLSFEDLKARNLAVNFRQVGKAEVPDNSKPKILSISRISSRNVPDTSSLIRYQVQFRDSGTGISEAYLDLSNQSFNLGFEKHYSIGGNLAGPGSCSFEDEETKGKVCLVSGDNNQGVLEFSLYAPIFGMGGAHAPASVMLSDKATNSFVLGYESFSKSTLSALTVNLPSLPESGDTYGPVISDLKWSTTAIDTGEKSATFELLVSVADRQSGLGYNKRGQPNIRVSFSWASPKSAQNGKDNYWANFSQTVSRVSGNQKDGKYKITISVPAHSKRGQIYLNSIIAIDNDRKKNISGLDFDQLISLGFQTSIRNG